MTTKEPCCKTIRARLKPELVSIVEKAKSQGYTEAELVREGIRLFGKQMKTNTEPMEVIA